MLAELRVQNLAVFDQVQLELAPGLVVFTGETGAGKSLLMAAVELLVGARADSDIVRSGARAAIVEGRFLLRGPSAEVVRKLLAEEELLDSDDEFVVAREVRSDGRSVARVNGRMVKVGLLRSLAQHLIDVHGQGSHLSLLRPAQQLDLLDRYARADRTAAELREVYAQLLDRIRALERLNDVARNAARERDVIEFELREIEEAAVSPEEEAELTALRRRLAHAQALADQTSRCLALLDDDGLCETASASDLLGRAHRILLDVARIDPQQTPLAERLGALCDELEEIVRQVRRYAEQCEPDPQQLDQVERRLATLERLKRKYGPTLADVLAYRDRLRERLAELEDVGDRGERLQEEIKMLASRADALACKLTRARKRAARALAQAICRELASLGFLQTQFEIALRPSGERLTLPGDEVLKVSASGAERVEFLLAANPGEPLKPLAAVASGGETARLMLAFKAALAAVDPVPTLVFDEIDQGVGGRAGLVVGRRLKALADYHQVLCVTHLPQVAAFADQHLAVTKHTVRRRTQTAVRSLVGEERVEELASMLGAVSAAGRASARELLEAATRN